MKRWVQVEYTDDEVREMLIERAKGVARFGDGKIHVRNLCNGAGWLVYGPPVFPVGKPTRKGAK